MNNYQQLNEALSSGVSANILHALRSIRDDVCPANCTQYAQLVSGIVGNDDDDCKWQSLIIIGECVEEHPSIVWPFIEQYGESENEDTRDAIATVLLEHLMEHHFDEYWPLIRKMAKKPKSLFADTLSRCWPFGQAISHWDEVQELVKETISN